MIVDDYDLDPSFIKSKAKDPYGFCAGAELEIESCKDWSGAFLKEHGIVKIEDGSLRNNGFEFLLPPSNSEDLIYLFEKFHHQLEVGENAFSFRTSTHVHVNMMFQTQEQCKSLLFLYSIFEPLAFSFVGSDRKSNIHCVPLNSTHMPSLYKRNLVDLRERWSKYTALNLIPLAELGTMEFRHLGGTGDVERFAAWIHFLERLWKEAMALGTFPRNLLLDLKYLQGVQDKLLTPEFRKNCLEPIDFELEQNLMDVKLAFTN